MKRTGFKGLVAAGLVATGIAASTSAVAASDMFLKLGNVKGESTDQKHKGEIDVLAWSWGQSTGDAQTKKGRVPAACIQDLALTKFVDSASPALIMMGVTGQVVPEAVLTVRKTGQDGQGQDYFTLRLTNVTVPAYQTGGSTGDNNNLSESVVLRFDSLQGEYRAQDAKGTLLPPVFFNVTGGGCK
jgi:type VI secretion system secreted protein Hcp